MVKNKNYQKSSKYVIFLVIIAFFLIFSALRILWEDYPDNSQACAIEYGNGKCMNGSLSIPFYNPGASDITSIKITVPSGTKTSVLLPAEFNVDEPLAPGKAGILTLIPCEEELDISSFGIKWCCNSLCSQSVMYSPDEKLNIEK